MNPTSQHTLCIVLFLFLISACTEGGTSIHQYISTVKNRSESPIEAMPVLTPWPAFIFPENDTRRSPFKPTKQKKKTQHFKSQRTKEPLEAYPLRALKFIGVLKDKQRLWALIGAPSKEIVSVTVGNYIGLNRGRITAIKNNKIKLEETMKTLGYRKKHKATLFMDSSN